ncbi:MAG: HEAT repeat domain-containing protein [Candidatus Xenobia bacterium]
MSEDGSDFLKKALVNALADFGNRDALMASENMLRHANPAVRKQQVEFLARYRRQYGGDVFSVLSDGFDDPTALVREGTLMVALEMPDEKLIPKVVELLASGSGPDATEARDSRKNVDRRRNAADYIRACASQQELLVEPVLALIEDSHTYLPCRLEAMRALQYEHKMGRVRDVLLGALEATDGGVRSYAVQTLPYYQNHNDVAVAISRQLASTESEDVLLARLGALVKLADQASIETFAKYLKHESLAVRELAVEGLHATQATRYRDSLLKLWEQLPDPMGEEHRMRKVTPRRPVTERRPEGEGEARPARRPAAGGGFGRRGPDEEGSRSGLEREPDAGGAGRGPRAGGPGRGPGGPARGPRTAGPGGPARGPRVGGPGGPARGPRAAGPGGPARGPRAAGPGGPARGPRAAGPGGPARGPRAGGPRDAGPGGPGRGPGAGGPRAGGPGRGPGTGPGRGPGAGGPGRGPSAGPGRGPGAGGPGRGPRAGGPGRGPGGPGAGPGRGPRAGPGRGPGGPGRGPGPGGPGRKPGGGPRR